MSEKFLFIEFIDEEINSFLLQLRCVLSNKKYATNIHVTLKGPQKTFRLENSIKKYKKDHQEIRIRGVGRFDNDHFHVVFFKVECGDLRKYKLWRKPDYKDEYDPHITIYESSCREIADAVYDYLESCAIDLTLRDYVFTEHTRKQMTLEYNSIEKKAKMTSLQLEHSRIIINAQKLIAKIQLRLCGHV